MTDDKYNRLPRLLERMKEENKSIFENLDLEEIKRLTVNLIEEKIQNTNMGALICLRSDDKRECLLIFDANNFPIKISVKFDE
jgi:hypothetical protein